MKLLERSLERKYLEDTYAKKGSQLLVLYGQENIGKTTLIKEFMLGKSFFYYAARSCSIKEQLHFLSEEIIQSGYPVVNNQDYSSVIQCLANNSSTKKILVIDEFQHLVKSGNAFMESIATLLQNNISNQEFLIILLSSSVSFVENSMVKKIGSVAFQITGFLKVKELSFFDITTAFPEYNVSDCLKTYSILGCIPGMWQRFDYTLSLKDNICKKILEKNSSLYHYVDYLISRELRETGVYYTILNALAQGKTKLNDLYLHTGFSRAKISVYLKNLMELEIVNKGFSYVTEGKQNTQKGIYYISNHFIFFYFKFVYSNFSDLELMFPEDFYETYINRQLDEYCVKYMGEVCRAFFSMKNEKKELPIYYTKCGEWIGKAGTIDVVAEDEQGKTLVGWCNDGVSVMKMEDYEWLLFCLKQAKINPDFIYLFARDGFDDSLVLLSKSNENIHIIKM